MGQREKSPYCTGRLPSVVESVYYAQACGFAKRLGPRRGKAAFYRWLRTIVPHAPLVTIKGYPFPKKLVEEAVRRGEVQKIQRAARRATASRRNPDEEIRRLQRLAAQGDKSAARKLASLKTRMGSKRGRWTTAKRLGRFARSVAKHPARTSTRLATYDVLSLDVWGNARDGFDVNNMFRTGSQITVAESAPDSEIISALIREGLLNERARKRVTVDCPGDSSFMTIEETRTGKPIFNLEQTNVRENPHQRAAGQKCGACKCHRSMHSSVGAFGRGGKGLGRCSGKNCSCKKFVQKGDRYYPSRSRGHRGNPNRFTPKSVSPAGASDQDAADELSAYIHNEGSLYRQRQSIEANVLRKIKGKRYDYRLAPRLWQYWVDAGARKYAKEFGTRFTPETRRSVALDFARDFEAQVRLGERGEENRIRTLTPAQKGRFGRANPLTRAESKSLLKRARGNLRDAQHGGKGDKAYLAGIAAGRAMTVQDYGATAPGLAAGAAALLHGSASTLMHAKGHRAIAKSMGFKPKRRSNGGGPKNHKPGCKCIFCSGAMFKKGKKK